METASWIQLGIAVVSGGALGAFFSYLLGNRKQNKDEFVVLIETYKKMVDDLKGEFRDERTKFEKTFEEHSKQIHQLQQAIVQKDKELIQLRNQLMIFESSHSDVPVPIWLKDTSGRMLFLNKEYEAKLLHPVGKSAADYIGHFDVDVWGPEVAKTFGKHDRKVMRTKKPEEVIESWPGPNGTIWEGRITKYPRFTGRDTVIGIGGIIVEMWIKEDNPTKK